MYKSIATEIAPASVIERVANLPLTFSPWSPELYEECMTKQRVNFGDNEVSSKQITLIIYFHWRYNIYPMLMLRVSSPGSWHIRLLPN